MDKMDWLAAMDSEIFREYLKNETLRINAEAQTLASVDVEEEKVKLLNEFEAFEADIKLSPRKLATFRALQKKFASDPEYAEKCKPGFVSAVMMLNLD